MYDFNPVLRNYYSAGTNAGKQVIGKMIEELGGREQEVIDAINNLPHIEGGIEEMRKFLELNGIDVATFNEMKTILDAEVAKAKLDIAVKNFKDKVEITGGLGNLTSDRFESSSKKFLKRLKEQKELDARRAANGKKPADSAGI